MDCFNNMNEMIENFKTGAFLTVKSGSEQNVMTINWGYTGIMWNKPYFMVLVRPSRHTHELIKNATNFTVSIPKKGTMKNELGICGSQSGRDINKGEVVNYLPSKRVESPVIEGCQMYYECKINYITPLDEASIPAEIKDKVYTDNCYHILYFGEIVEYYEN